MIQANQTIIDNLNAPLRQITSKVELFDGSTLLNTFRGTDNIISIASQRIGEGKFFGYGVSQKTTIQLTDKERAIDIKEDNIFNIYFDDIKVSPNMYASNITRDENTNILTIEAKDALKRTSAITIEDLYLNSYTIGEFIGACATALGLAGVRYINIPEDEEIFSYVYDSGANFNGNENLRTGLNGAADALQAIYYIDTENYLVFKRLDKDGEPLLTVGKDKYFFLITKANRKLSAICSATELGDNLTATLDEEGLTHYIKDNPFWDMREDRADLVDNALATIGGLSITEFNSKWRGNYLVEIGDKLSFITKDDDTVYTYLLNDTYNYTGGFNQTSLWEYSKEDEKPNNPTTLGEAINQTFAKVDKVNKKVEIVVSETEGNTSKIAKIEEDTETITASVGSIKDATEEALEEMNNHIADIEKKASLAITEDAVNIKITEAMSNGVDKVETTTGVRVDKDGLTVDKSDSEMKTTITEDGMTVYKNDEITLTANNQGVDAKNLKATTYLIVGKNSRFEDYDDNRTGCFWIGE